MESGGKRATVEVVVEVLRRLDREMRECQDNTPEWLQRVSASRWLLDETDKAGNLLAVVTRFKREVGHTPFLDTTHLRSSHRPGSRDHPGPQGLLLRPHLRIKPLCPGY